MGMWIGVNCEETEVGKCEKMPPQPACCLVPLPLGLVGSWWYCAATKSPSQLTSQGSTGAGGHTICWARAGSRRVNSLAGWGKYNFIVIVIDGALVAVLGAGVALSGGGLVPPGNGAVPLHALCGQPQHVVAALARVRLPVHHEPCELPDCSAPQKQL